MKQLTVAEQSHVGSWVKTGVLNKIDAVKLHAATAKGGILCFCGDCDHSWDFVSHLILNLGVTKHLHFKSYNGGALRLNAAVPIPEEFRCSDQLLAGISASSKLKGLNTLLLQTHITCGMAGLSGLTIEDTLWFLLDTVSLVAHTTGWGRKQIVPLFHVCDSNGDRRTYFVEPEAPRELIYLAA